jgi:hypothetical protein
LPLLYLTGMVPPVPKNLPERKAITARAVLEFMKEAR